MIETICTYTLIAYFSMWNAHPFNMGSGHSYSTKQSGIPTWNMCQQVRSSHNLIGVQSQSPAFRHKRSNVKRVSETACVKVCRAPGVADLYPGISSSSHEVHFPVVESNRKDDKRRRTGRSHRYNIED